MCNPISRVLLCPIAYVTRLLGDHDMDTKSRARGDMPDWEVICMLTLFDAHQLGFINAISRLGSA